MLDLDETIDAFRRDILDLDCKRMVLSQHKEGGERFEGQGYIRQSASGALTFKTYVTHHNAKPFGHLEAQLGAKPGKVYGDEMFYDLDATGDDGTHWTATRILPAAHWDATDLSVLINGQV